jgi:uncharacterized protein YodC (DUF2158 family)
MLSTGSKRRAENTTGKRLLQPAFTSARDRNRRGFVYKIAEMRRNRIRNCRNAVGDCTYLKFRGSTSIFVSPLSRNLHDMNSAVIFQRGDMVQRNTGGPRMMVEEIENPGTVIRCKWYEGRERCVGRFFVEGLRLVPSSDA